MNAITLPKDLEAWAEAEVAAGRAESVGALATVVLTTYRRQMDAFRASLDEASADVKAGNGIPLEEIMAEFERLYPDEA
jgi:hypothetical protein